MRGIIEMFLITEAVERKTLLENKKHSYFERERINAGCIRSRIYGISYFHGSNCHRNISAFATEIALFIIRPFCMRLEILMVFKARVTWQMFVVFRNFAKAFGKLRIRFRAKEVGEPRIAPYLSEISLAFLL